MENLDKHCAGRVYEREDRASHDFRGKIEGRELLVDYHVRRNEVAGRSHAKTWRAKYPDVKFLRL